MNLVAIILSIFLHFVFFFGVIVSSNFNESQSEGIVLNFELVSLAPHLDESPKITPHSKKKRQSKNSADKKTVIAPKPELKVKKNEVKEQTKIIDRKADNHPRGIKEKTEKAVVERKKKPVVRKSSPNGQAIVLKQGIGVTIGNKTIVIKRGAGRGRSLDAVAAYSFDEDYFWGNYETSSGRKVEIIDARKECGRLILYDSRTGLKRKLRNAEMGDFIYTYGPSFNEDFPVKGSIVFLPGSGHWIQRFMWMPEKGPSVYPDKLKH